jgi:Rod binding domain-containing protein
VIGAINLPTGAGPASMARAARDFEAQALGALLQPIFEALPTKGPFGGGTGEAQWRPMLVDAIARDFTRAGGVGIANAVLREMLAAQERARAGQQQGQGDSA